MPGKMRLLSFDTSGATISLCLMEDGEVKLARAIEPRTGQRQDAVVMLMPSIDELIRDAGLGKGDLSSIVVGCGPGSFTGIRTAVVTARTLSQALSIPLIGIGLLECYAFESGLPCGIIVSGGKGHYYFAAYDLQPEEDWRPEDKDRRSLAVMRELIPAEHGTRESIESSLSTGNRWFADAQSYESLAGSGIKLERLQTPGNVAVTQAKLASAEITLRIRALRSTIVSGPEDGGSPDEENGPGIIDLLRRDFPYQKVMPLYVRGASITLKGNNGKATACN